MPRKVPKSHVQSFSHGMAHAATVIPVNKGTRELTSTHRHRQRLCLIVILNLCISTYNILGRIHKSHKAEGFSYARLVNYQYQACSIKHGILTY